MAGLALAVAVSNFLFSALRFYWCLKAGRLMAIVWFLVAYFGWFFIPVAIAGPFKHYRGFTGDYLYISQQDIDKTLLFVLMFNVLFLLAETSVGMLTRAGKRRQQWVLSLDFRYLTRLQWAFFVALIVGALVYGVTAWKQSYSDYVAYQGSGWGLVLLWSSAPLITIAALRKKYLIALLGCIPFVYFAAHLHVRSFALFSLVPVTIIYLLQATTGRRAGLLQRTKTLIWGAGLVLGLLLLSSAILVAKSGGKSTTFTLPDAEMPYNAVIVRHAIDKFHVATDWDGLILYARNLVNPFLRVFQKFGVTIVEPRVDPPVVMAGLIEGVPKNWEVFYHYPTLWYSDAYMAFGNYGLLLAVLWAAVLRLWEWIMARNLLLFGMLLPFYSWHVYMLIRGATAGSTVPFSYSVYVVFIIAVALGGMRALKTNGEDSVTKKERHPNSVLHMKK